MLLQQHLQKETLDCSTEFQMNRIKKKKKEGISGLNKLHLFTHLIYIHI